MELLIAKYNYWIAIILAMIGLYGIIAKNNLVKKVIGLTILQTAIFLLYISTGVKTGATIPIITQYGSDMQGVHAVQFANPLPHVLVLTAIVVGVATLGVALSLIQKIYKTYGTIEEQQLRSALSSESASENQTTSS